MKRKIIAASLIACMILVAVTGATLAYFTDKDYLKNEFAVGGVDIDLWEIVDYDGNEQVTIGRGDDERHDYTYEDLYPTDHATKQVHIENIGETAAYVRVTVVMNHTDEINDAIDEVYEKKDYTAERIQAVYDEVFEGWGINYSKRAEYPNGTRMWMDSRVGEDSPVLCNIDTIARLADSYYRIDCANQFMTAEERATENGDGIFDVDWDDLGVSYYVDAVKTGERAYFFYLELEAGEDYILFDGLNVPADFDEEQAKMFEGLKINVYADAIQTAGFDGDWEAAFNALDEIYHVGHWNAE